MMLPDAELYIDGEMRPASNGRVYDNIGPWTGEVVGKAADASAEDVEAAIVAARRAFDETDWSRDHAKRLELMTRFRDGLRAERDHLGEIARIEGGTSIGATYASHVDGALNGADGMLEAFPEVVWEEDRGRRKDRGRFSDRRVVKEAIGVAGAITPWNAPFYVNIGKLFGALLAGCTVILKAAPETPLAGSVMGRIAKAAGLPPGVLNVITSKDPAMAGEMLVTDPRVDLITFTGSTAVGKRIMEKGAPTLKRVFLELGGKSANILLDDAPHFPIVVAASIVIYHAAQGCATPTRLLVPRSRYAEAIEALEKGYAALETKWGDYEAPDQTMGPLISKRQLDRVMGYIEIGKQEGARLLAGGKARPDKGTGFFVEPTCFVDVTNDMRIAREEIFGPVLVVIPYEDEADAIRIANDSDYGLAGMVMSADMDRAMRVARAIRAGAISVNGGMSIAPDLPFGGYKHSGIGREWGREGIEEFLETKAIAVGVAAA